MHNKGLHDDEQRTFSSVDVVIKKKCVSSS